MSLLSLVLEAVIDSNVYVLLILKGVLNNGTMTQLYRVLIPQHIMLGV